MPCKDEHALTFNTTYKKIISYRLKSLLTDVTVYFAIIPNWSNIHFPNDILSHLAQGNIIIVVVFIVCSLTQMILVIVIIIVPLFLIAITNSHKVVRYLLFFNGPKTCLLIIGFHGIIIITIFFHDFLLHNFIPDTLELFQISFRHLLHQDGAFFEPLPLLEIAHVRLYRHLFLGQLGVELGEMGLEDGEVPEGHGRALGGDGAHEQVVLDAEVQPGGGVWKEELLVEEKPK